MTVYHIYNPQNREKVAIHKTTRDASRAAKIKEQLEMIFSLKFRILEVEQEA